MTAPQATPRPRLSRAQEETLAALTPEWWAALSAALDALPRVGWCECRSSLGTIRVRCMVPAGRDVARQLTGRAGT